MGMTDKDLNEMQSKANCGVCTPDDVKKLVHEINLLRALVKDIRQSTAFQQDTCNIILGER